MFHFRMPVWQSVSYRDGEEVFPEDGRAVNLRPLNQQEIQDRIVGFFGFSPRIPQTANHRSEPNGWFGKLMGFSPYQNHQGISTYKLDQMVFRDDAVNRYYVNSWDLCNCPRVVGKGVGQTCKDKEGKRSCQPGSSMHDKSRNCILKRHPGIVLVDGASIHDGKLDLKSMTINVKDANGLMLRSKFRELQAAVLNDYDRSLAL